jgi:hypothetical protein
MKGKLLVIIAFISLLSFAVFKMMRYEENLRDEKIITLFVEDETKPLFEILSDEDLMYAANNSKYDFKAEGKYFKELVGSKVNGEIVYQWTPMFLRGVNLGFAVPGKFPSEFSFTFDEYLEWFELIGNMNSNVIRTYTILPPEFYKALSYYNLKNYNKRLFLIQGVWATIEKDGNYLNPTYDREFSKEIIDVIDVIHGNAVIDKKQGKASGVYSNDISKYVIAILLGREWEPSAVYKTNKINKNITQFEGRFIHLNNGNAMESWLASKIDLAILYETQLYQYQHPISFVNWLPLDPMFHNTEIIENKKVREYDNDLEKVDFEKYHSTDLFNPGIYAAYHAYPYYPDYIYLQENYANTVNPDGEKDNYYGYLKDLKNHCRGMPLLIAEYGLPSSRGNSHSTPLGLNQGGHSEAQQAQLSLTLTKDIFQSDCAGAVYFEWSDEWFKHNWLVMDFEVPFEDRNLWHNMENPEQNFGIYAYESRTKEIDGRLFDWKIEDSEKVQFDADPGYFYMTSHMPELDFDLHNLYIAIDTYEEEKGDHNLPFTNKYYENGFEFLCEFKSKNEAEILVDEHYSVFTDIYNDHIPVYSSKSNANGQFISQMMLTNRGRVDLLGHKSDSSVQNRGKLMHGNTVLSDNSNADWFFNDSTKNIEIRLDWHLLNVSDPAKKFVLDDLSETRAIEVSQTSNFHIYYFIADKYNNVINQYPEGSPFSYSWEGWDEPQYKKRLKPLYDTLATYFGQISRLNLQNSPIDYAEDNFNITDFKNGKKGAISISFANAGYSQFHLSSSILNKYKVKATFGVIPQFLDDSPGLYDVGEGVKIKRLSEKDISSLGKSQHDIALQLTSQGNMNQMDQMKEWSTSLLLYLDANDPPADLPDNFMFVRKPASKAITQSEFLGIPYFLVNSNSINILELDSILKQNNGDWTIINYQHLYDTSAAQAKINERILNKYYIEKSAFDRQLRLSRNSNYWMATESKVYKYLTEKKASKIDISRHDNLIFLNVINELNSRVFNEPLTVKYTTNAKMIRVEGSENDGIFNNRTGSILINVLPNSEVILEIIEP